jgi:8-oxo-dGTP pyrophosphatase MutT (NUDIX family)
MPPSENRHQLTIKQLFSFIGPLILAAFYTLSTHRTYYHSPVDNGIKFDQSSSTHIIITTPTTTTTTTTTQQQENNHPTATTIMSSDLNHDYSNDDYRAFLFAQHPIHGLLLLYCSRKKKKTPHFQAPGGHIDKEDFDAALTRLQNGINSISVADGDSSHPLLVLACKIGVARELYEETGIDIRNDLDRLQPVRLREDNKEDNGLTCVLKHRLFFKICFTDDDFVTEGFDSKMALGLSQAMYTEEPSPIKLMIKLSHEHQGFIFEPNTRKAVDLLTQHSGGKISTALSLAIDQGEIKDVASTTTTTAGSTNDDEPDKIVGHPLSNEAMDQTEGEKGVKGMFECFDCCRNGN